MGEYVVGIDLGGTGVKTVVLNGEKNICAKDTRPTPSESGPEAVMDVLWDSAQSAVAEAGTDMKDVVAVGIGTPGPLNWQTGIVYETPNMAGWKNVKLAEGMQNRLRVPCYLDNDANVACYGEFMLGAGRGSDTMCALTLGTGVGGGIVVFGKLLRGVDGTAAELGHMIVNRNGRECGCGAKGCLEAYGSVTGMVRTAVEGIESGKKTSLTETCQGDMDKITGKMISQAAEKGDEFAKWVIQETGAWLGVGVATLINALNPEKIVLAGGMINAGDLLFDSIRQTAKELCFDVPYARVQIVPAGLGGDAGAIGAAGCGLARHEENS